MVNELFALKAEAEKEILYAKAKIEIVDKLLLKVAPVPVKEEIEVDEQSEFEMEQDSSDENELNEV